MSIGIGDGLRAAREEQGRTIEEASRATRVRADYLRALEEERFDRIGGDVYAKGFLATYARWLGLDAEPLLERYRREVQRGDYDPHALVEHPVARSAREGATNWVMWAAVVVLVLLVGLGVIGTFGGRTPQQAAEPEIANSPSPSETDGTEPATEPETPTSPQTPTEVDLALLMEGSSWIRVQVDGEVVFEGTVPAGEQRSFTATSEVHMRLGNAGDVRLVLNGEDLGSIGGRGEVVEIVCEPTDCQLASEADDDGTSA